jgi:hypothetical protein
MLLMKKIFMFLFVFVVLAGVLSGCYSNNGANAIESQQQETGVLSIIQNQPVPDLGGYSFERDIVIKTYIARNQTIATYAYTMTLDGKFIELCPSIGYPIPYSTQLTAPEKMFNRGPGYEQYYDASVIPQSEPNGLYPPGDAAATLIQCVNPDGTVSPMYFEYYVIAMPYRIVSDFQLVRVDDKSSFSVDVNK